MANPEVVQMNLGLVSVKKSALENLKKSSGRGEDIGPLLSSYASNLINLLGQGGMMLKGSDLAEIEQATGTAVNSPADVVNGFKTAKGRPEGQYQFNVVLDPGLYASCEQTAQWRGMSVPEVLTEVVNTVISNSWCESWEGHGGPIQLSERDRKDAEEMLGKKVFFGADLVQALRDARAKK